MFVIPNILYVPFVYSRKNGTPLGPFFLHTIERFGIPCIMIPRISLRAACYISSQATLSPKPSAQSASSVTTGSSGSTTSQHPHAQLEEIQKNNQNVAQAQSSQSFMSSEPSSSTGPSSGTNSSSSVPPNAISIRDPQPSSDFLPQITPFHTYKLFTALESTFATPVARTLMESVRGLLVDRTFKIRRDALDVKDLDNVCLAHLITAKLR